MMMIRNYRSTKHEEKKISEDWQAVEDARLGKNRKGGTGHKMSDEKRLKARRNRKRRN